MSKNDDELNDFVDEVTDGVYNLPCLEVICKLVKQMHSRGDERIKKIVAALAAAGMKISSGLQMFKITYVNTVQRETISIEEALEKAVMPEKMKLILKARTQMVESIYKYFDLDLSESHRAKLYICTLLDRRFKKVNYWSTHKYVNNSQLCTDSI
jgi:adenylosuccinate synthase